MQWVLDLSVFFQVVLYIMGSVAAIAAGAAGLVKLWKWARRPHEETSAALEQYKLDAAAEHNRLQCAITVNQKAIENINAKMESEHEAVYRILEKDKKRMDGYDANFKILYRGMLALLDQQLNPNGNLEQMKKTRDDLESHIIDT